MFQPRPVAARSVLRRPKTPKSPNQLDTAQPSRCLTLCAISAALPVRSRLDVRLTLLRPARARFACRPRHGKFTAHSRFSLPHLPAASGHGVPGRHGSAQPAECRGGALLKSLTKLPDTIIIESMTDPVFRARPALPGRAPSTIPHTVLVLPALGPSAEAASPRDISLRTGSL